MTYTREGYGWLRSFHPGDREGIRLVCFPHAGGSATYYRPLSVLLSPNVRVLAVQYPGRQDRRHEPTINSIAVMADELLAELGTSRVPTAFFGHSMGAVLAFEVARRWETRGFPPTTLFVSARRAPSILPRHPVPESDEELLSMIRRLGGTDSGLLDDEEFVRMILPAVRNDYQAAERYRYQPGPDVSCPVVALIGDNDPQVSLSEVEKWREHTTGPFFVRVFGGGHFYLDSHREEVARLLLGSADVVA
jgi:pyochelin biosynthesis protein PchC